jgi:hypothetical protein
VVEGVLVQQCPNKFFEHLISKRSINSSAGSSGGWERGELMDGRSLVRGAAGFDVRDDLRPGKPGPPVESDRVLGVEVDDMSPRARVAVALTVLVPVVLSGLFLVAFVPGLWWVFTTYGWISLPAFGLLVRGISELREGLTRSDSLEGKEKELLRAIREWGELTPTRAAMETSLSVAEADAMLRDLAEGGHLEVRVRGGALFYALRARPAT